jgi:hypothetical protein
VTEADLRAKVAMAVEIVSDIDPELRAVVAREVLRALLTSGSMPEPQRMDRGPVPSSDELPETLVEALATLGGRSHQDTLVAILAYRLRTGADDALTVTDLGEAYRDSRLPRPQNMSDTIAKAMRKGWIVPANSKNGQKAWRVTSLGLKAFDGWRAQA